MYLPYTMLSALQLERQADLKRAARERALAAESRKRRWPGRPSRSPAVRAGQLPHPARPRSA